MRSHLVLAGYTVWRLLWVHFVWVFGCLSKVGRGACVCVSLDLLGPRGWWVPAIAVPSDLPLCFSRSSGNSRCWWILAPALARLCMIRCLSSPMQTSVCMEVEAAVQVPSSAPLSVPVSSATPMLVSSGMGAVAPSEVEASGSVSPSVPFSFSASSVSALLVSSRTGALKVRIASLSVVLICVKLFWYQRSRQVCTCMRLLHLLQFVPPALRALCHVGSQWL